MSILETALTLRCGKVLPHRVALAPLTNKQSNSDGSLHEDEFNWLARRAGEFAVVSTCAAYVSDEGKAWDGQLGIANDDHVPGLSALAATIEDEGSFGLVQLHHAGAKADLAPRKLSTFDHDDVHGATEADITRVTADFVAAAKRAEEAGFDGVEIHGANGYIFTQFLAPKDNPRTDAYGGELSARARFLRETLRAVRAATSPGFAVGVRISPVDVWAVRGIVLDDSLQLVQWLAEDGADFVHLSLGDASGPAPHGDADTIVATAIREALPSNVALFAAGGIWTRDDARRATESGVDVVVLGRAAIAHPDWPKASLATDFAASKPPWDPQQLTDASVGPGLLEYLRGFAGMVVGGRPPR